MQEWYIHDNGNANGKAQYNDRGSFMQSTRSWSYEVAMLLQKAWIQPCVRLNGTTDIQWENIKIDYNIFELFPEVQWYDYTKIANRRKVKV